MESADALLNRLRAPAGLVLIALTAAPWLTREHQGIREYYSKWDGLVVANSQFLGLAVAAAVIIVLMGALIAVAASPAATVAGGSLILLDTIISMLNTDGGFTPASGAWITAALSACMVALGLAASMSQRRR
ncbi:hypothetical protein [Cumulibacter soli]|uniref:hypothetical protein n=1 Tax=Cumulibacter soli TaxID=2546344 RepID=UPI0010681746|nr:hypothetical protein [Cumulibacter soli]